MAPQVIDVHRTTPAPPDAVWRLLGDSTTWPDWTPVDRVEIQTPAGVDGRGEVRRVRSGRFTILEAVVHEPPTRLSYTLLGGLPLRDYAARITLSPAPAGGTEIHWHTTFAPKIPGTGGLFRRRLHQLTEQFVDGLARAAAAG